MTEIPSNCTWVGGVSPADQPPLSERRSNSRGRKGRAKILSACRSLMIGGSFRPTTAEVAERAGCSLRTIFDQFGDIGTLHVEAVKDEATSDAILRRVLGDDYSVIGAPDHWFDRIVHAVVVERAA